MEFRLNNYSLQINTDLLNECELIKLLSNTIMKVENYITIPDNICNNDESLLYLQDFLENKYSNDVLENLHDLIKMGEFLMWNKLNDFIKNLRNIEINFESNLFKFYINNDYDINVKISIDEFKKINVDIPFKVFQNFYESTNIEPYMIQNKNVSKYHNIINDYIGFELVWFNDMYIAGGILGGIINSDLFYKYSDIDIWLLNDCDKNINQILQNIKPPYFTICDRAILRIILPFSKIKSIQIIKVNNKNILDLLENFDMDVCRLAIGKDNLYFNYNGYMGIKNKIAKGFSLKLKRYHKYLEKGYNINDILSKNEQFINNEVYEKLRDLFDNMENFTNMAQLLNSLNKYYVTFCYDRNNNWTMNKIDDKKLLILNENNMLGQYVLTDYDNITINDIYITFFYESNLFYCEIDEEILKKYIGDYKYNDKISINTYSNNNFHKYIKGKYHAKSCQIRYIEESGEIQISNIILDIEIFYCNLIDDL